MNITPHEREREREREREGEKRRRGREREIQTLNTRTTMLEARSGLNLERHFLSQRSLPGPNSISLSFAINEKSLYHYYVIIYKYKRSR